jgi:hypothetical protein
MMGFPRPISYAMRDHSHGFKRHYQMQLVQTI